MTQNFWQRFIDDEKEKEYFKKILCFLESEEKDAQKNSQIFPSKENIFKSFELTPFENLKVVILGQDPYHGAGEAVGLSFSVPTNIKIPPSLKNIFKEIISDLQISNNRTSSNFSHGDLSGWATQGVLLLNTTLTVEKDKPASHAKIGWHNFTDEVIKKISEEKEHVVFLLWGKHAQEKINLIDASKHLILAAPHPSPFSCHTGFFGCKHFSKTNQYLHKTGQTKINWLL